MKELWCGEHVVQWSRLPFSFMLGLLNYCTKCDSEASDGECEWVWAWVRSEIKKNHPEKAELFQWQCHSDGDNPCRPHHTRAGATPLFVCAQVGIEMFFQEKRFSASQTTACEGWIFCYLSGLWKPWILIILLAFLLSEVKVTEVTEESWSEPLMLLAGF